MESKKASMFASLMEDDSDGPGAATFSPSSSFQDGHSVRGGDTESAALGPNLNLSQQSLSCVTRETSLEDCARHRFIVWAAVKRNSSKRMNPEEKLECPLLRCTLRFPDHESMLKHLAGCTFLASGEYWCYDHMRVERFDDLKCKRCLGHPSKRKKMLSMAKTFFHSLGHKSSKKAHGGGFDSDDTLLLPPPSYDSLGLTPLDVTELPSTELVELDSVDTTVAGTDGAIDPQALLVPVAPSLPELDSAMPPNDPFMQWQPSPFPLSYAEDYGDRSPGAKPALQVNTHGLPPRRHAAPRPAPRPVPVASRSKGLSPSSSVRSTASTDTTDTTTSTSSNVSSLVSPASNWSGAWSMASGMNTNLTSPVEGLIGDPFAGAVYDNSCPEFLHSFYSELPADIPVSKVEASVPPNPTMPFHSPTPIDVMFTSSLALTDNPTSLVDVDEPEVEETNVCCSETKSVVGSAWDALQEHFVSSTLKIQHLPRNHLVDQLKPMSMKTIATSGLRTLRMLLDGGQPSSAIDTICFVHLMYAFSLVVHQNEASDRSKQFFLQSLSYANLLPPSDRTSYNELAACIWEPTNLNQEDIARYLTMDHLKSPSRASSLKGKEHERPRGGCRNGMTDLLLCAARDFLDELEMSLVLGQIPSSPEVQGSELYAKHLQDISSTSSVNFAFIATIKYLLMSALAEEYADAETLKNRLNEVVQRVSTGIISSVRRVEIELLCAGKECLSAKTFFDSYTPRVRGLCDSIYEQHDAGASRRNAYHQAGILLIERLIPEFDRPTGDPLFDENDDLDEFFERMTAECDPNVVFPIDLMGSSGGCEPLKALQIPTVVTTSVDSALFGSQASEQQQRQEMMEDESPDQQGQKVEADSCCDICGYRPKGDPQWFKGSMAKHKKLQHSTAPPKIYKCPFPGCTSQYKNRPDNLRQHQIEKNHWVASGETTPRRPSKRKKVEVDE